MPKISKQSSKSEKAPRFNGETHSGNKSDTTQSYDNKPKQTKIISLQSNSYQEEPSSHIDRDESYAL